MKIFITIIYEEAPAFVDIKQAIADALGVSFQDIIGRKRENKYVYARMIFAQLCRKEGATVLRIAKEMSHNHATVIYYLKKYQDDYKYLQMSFFLHYFVVRKRK